MYIHEAVKRAQREKGVIYRTSIKSKEQDRYAVIKPIIRNLEPERASEAQISTIVSICKKHKIEPEMLYSSNDLSKDTLTAEQAGKLLQALKKKFGDD